MHIRSELCGTGNIDVNESELEDTNMAFDDEIHGVDMEIETESVRNELQSISDDDSQSKSRPSSRSSSRPQSRPHSRASSSLSFVADSQEVRIF